MATIEFKVPAVPVAQPRQRHRVVKGKDGCVFASNFTPKRDPVNYFKATVRMAAESAYSGPPLEGPIGVELSFVFPRPKGKVWKKKAMPRLEHTSKPDVDNLFKSVADALSGLLWRDDAQICTTVITKWVASGDESAHVYLRVAALKGGPNERA